MGKRDIPVTPHSHPGCLRGTSQNLHPYPLRCSFCEGIVLAPLVANQGHGDDIDPCHSMPFQDFPPSTFHQTNLLLLGATVASQWHSPKVNTTGHIVGHPCLFVPTKS